MIFKSSDKKTFIEIFEWSGCLCIDTYDSETNKGVSQMLPRETAKDMIGFLNAIAEEWSLEDM